MMEEKERLARDEASVVPDCTITTAGAAFELEGSTSATNASLSERKDGLQYAPPNGGPEDYSAVSSNQEASSAPESQHDDNGDDSDDNNDREVDEEATPVATIEEEEETFYAYIPGKRRKRANRDPVLVDSVRVEERSGRRLYYAIGALILLAGLVVGVTVGVTQSNNKSTTNKEQTDSPSTVAIPSPSPSFSPSTASPTINPTLASFQVIMNDLALDFQASTMTALQLDYNSPQSRAARWMMEEDQAFTFPLNETDPKSMLRRRFRQRFALTTLYFSTGGDTSWVNQGAFLSPTLHECDWGGTRDEAQSPLVCRTECFIRAVHNLTISSCDDELPVPAALVLKNNHLVGSIPPEIGALTSMFGIEFQNNELTGSLPDEIYNLSYLGVLQLDNNQLNGSFDRAIKNWNHMIRLDVVNNQMTGTLPSEIAVMSGLESLDLSSNFFSGTIPPELHQSFTQIEIYQLENCMFTGTLPPLVEMTQLQMMYLFFNELNGTLPTEFAATLTSLAVFDNQFSGTFPTEYATSSALVKIYVEANRLTGTIPNAWATNKSALHMVGNAFTGTIPSELGNLSGLDSFDVGSPGLTGTIPTELGNLSLLVYLNIAQSPNLQGTIPTELGMLRKIEEFRLPDNDLSGTLPSQLGGATSMVVLGVLNNPRLTGSLPASFTNVTPAILWLDRTNMTGNTSVICDRYQPEDFTADCYDIYCPCCTLCLVDGNYQQVFNVYTNLTI